MAPELGGQFDTERSTELKRRSGIDSGLSWPFNLLSVLCGLVDVSCALVDRKPVPGPRLGVFGPPILESSCLSYACDESSSERWPSCLSLWSLYGGCISRGYTEHEGAGSGACHEAKEYVPVVSHGWAREIRTIFVAVVTQAVGGHICVLRLHCGQ